MAGATQRNISEASGGDTSLEFKHTAGAAFFKSDEESDHG